MIPITYTCPLGGICERVVDGHIERCAWYVTLEGVNPQTGEKAEPQSKCGMAWLPILMIDNTGKTDRVSDAVNQLRDTVSVINPIQLLMREEKLIEG